MLGLVGLEIGHGDVCYDEARCFLTFLRFRLQLLKRRYCVRMNRRAGEMLEEKELDDGNIK